MINIKNRIGRRIGLIFVYQVHNSKGQKLVMLRNGNQLPVKRQAILSRIYHWFVRLYFVTDLPVYVL